MDEVDKLNRACPFCGSAAKIVESWNGINEIAICCSGDKLSITSFGCPASNSEQDEQGGFTFSCYGKEYLPKLIAAWNSRPIEDALRAENEKLRNTLFEIANIFSNGGIRTVTMADKCVMIAQQALNEVTK